MRPCLPNDDNRRARLPVALAVIALVGALSAGSVPARSAAAPATSVVPSASARAGVPAKFHAIASVFVPHSSMVFVLGSTLSSDRVLTYDVLRIYHGKTSYSVVKTTANEEITSIAAGSSSSVWVAGDKLNPDHPVILRKTGNSWRAVKLPRFAPGGAGVGSISASSPTNAWAVGYLPSRDNSVTDVLHWDGKRWKAVNDGQPLETSLGSVSTSSPTNVWALVNNEPHGKSENVLVHWNGHRWSRHNPAAHETLTSVVTDGRDRVWAVGSRPTGRPDQLDDHAPLTLRRDGSRWVTVREPKFRADVSLTQVAMRGSSIWAVGFNVANSKEYLLHSNGKAWTVVPMRQRGNTGTRGLFGISAGPKATALALGSYVTKTTCQTRRSHNLILVVHGRSAQRIDPTSSGGHLCSPPPPPPSMPARTGAPAGFAPIASTVVPHSSMEYVLGTTAEKTTSFRRYEVLRIYHGKTSYSVVGHTRHDAITSIATGAASEVWLGGEGRHYLSNGDYYAGPFIWRKAGNSWTAAKLPRRTSGDLDSISASSPTNAWAAGYLPSPDNSVADVLHWNGKTWKAVDTGQPPDPTWLSISTSSPTNVWAIQENELTHWNGHVWSLHDPAGANPVSSIATDGRKRVWAVGFRLTGQPGASDAHAAPYAVRLDGSRWVTVREPALPASTSLTQVAMRGSSIWAVGTRGTGNRELILHSNGRQLSVVPTRQPGNSSGVSDISAGPDETALALGSYTTGTKCPKIRYHSLILVVHVRSTRRIDPTVTGKASCNSTRQP